MAFLVSQSLLPSLAGRVVALVVVPGVLVAIAAVLWLLEKNHNKQVIILLCFVILYFTIVHPTFTIASVYFTLNNFITYLDLNKTHYAKVI